MATNYFLMGKGGVGKSTSAALTAVFLAQRGYRVLLVSMDPAHNQSDIFERQLGDAPVDMLPGLQVMEIDQELWIRTYLKNVHLQISRTYAYLTAFSLKKYFEVIKHSPDLEEYALMLAFDQIRTDYADRDYLIFDKPPTALSLKFFNLPVLSLVWIEHLLALRQEIIRKWELITRIKLPGKEIETDKVLQRIEVQRRQYLALKALFEGAEQTRIFLVLNPDKLSHAESLRIFEALRVIDIQLFSTIYNKRPDDAACAAVPSVFAAIPMINLPYSDVPLIGLSNLRRFLSVNGNILEAQLYMC